MRDVCAKGQPWFALGMVQARVVWHFAAGECHIWLSAESPPPWYVVEHERMHSSPNTFQSVDSTCSGRGTWSRTAAPSSERYPTNPTTL
jgi:hypothetical protein